MNATSSFKQPRPNCIRPFPVLLLRKCLRVPRGNSGRFKRLTMPGELDFPHDGNHALVCTPEQQERKHGHTKSYLHAPNNLR